MSMQEYLTPEEIANQLKVSKQLVRVWLREGQLVGIKIGRQWRVKPEALQEFLHKK